jgi:purine-binding chemotaxis protein CheW
MSNTQFVVFKLNNEYYGIDILKVREIGPYIESTKIPNTPEFIEGIINFRGDIIPIINLRKTFMLEGNGDIKGTRIIIANEGKRQLGIAVDEASEVLHIDSEDIESASDVVVTRNKKLVYGIGKVKDRIIILLDLAELININSDIMEAV